MRKANEVCNVTNSQLFDRVDPSHAHSEDRHADAAFRRGAGAQAARDEGAREPGRAGQHQGVPLCVHRQRETSTLSIFTLVSLLGRFCRRSSGRRCST